MREVISHGQLQQALHRLGYVGARVRENWRAFQHCESPDLILLPWGDRSAPARPCDIDTAKQHAVRSGLIEQEGEFEQLLRWQDHGDQVSLARSTRSLQAEAS